MARMQILKTYGPKLSGRSAPTVASLGSHIYLFGGLLDDFGKKINKFYNDFYQFDTERNTWQVLSPIGDSPTPRAHSVAVGDSNTNRILMFGGAYYSSDFSINTAFDELWEYDPLKNTWHQRPATDPCPSPRANAHIWLVDDNIYLFGGIGLGTDTSGEFFNDMWVYNIQSNRWTLLIPNNAPGSPLLRDLVNGGLNPSKEGKLIFYGGIGGHINRAWTLNDTWEFDLKTQQWQNITPSPEHNVLPPRDAGISVTIFNHIFMQGGSLCGVGSVLPEHCGSPFPQRCATDETWAFDQTKHIWSKLAVSGDPSPRLKYASAAVVDNKIYIFGGYDFIWFANTPNAEIYGNGPGQLWNENVYCLDPYSE